jgi:putative toxin-antitoxin system antitoxin component (TIGR02293 family)
MHGLAKDVLEDSKLAGEWMLRPNVHLRHERPLDMLDTKAGYDCVRDVLIRVAHGVCA